MPRPCAVEAHARGYQKRQEGLGCHGLAPWRLTLAATEKRQKGFADATALRRGILESCVAFSVAASVKSCVAFFVAASVKLHGARPWHQFECSHSHCRGWYF